MKYDVITLFPQIIQDYCSMSIMKRAIENDVITVNTTNPRDFTQDKHKRVDDTPYGGGAGMVLKCEPIFRAHKNIKQKQKTKSILLTPQGETFSHQKAIELSEQEQLIFICGHYEGFDERIRTELEVEEISLGDFVLTGGELGALCIMDSVTRQLEGALGKIESAHYDSFSEGLLEYPQYTKPYDFEGHKVPDILLSGNHPEVAKWRRKQEILRTMKKRPDLFKEFLQKGLSKEDKLIVQECLEEL